MSTRCVVYARVSTDAQERDGTSLDSQEAACAEFAAQNGWHVVRRVRDAASGATLDRPGIGELRSALRSGEADVVVAYAVDRLARSQNHIGVLFDEVEQAGAQLEFVTERFEDTAIGRFILAARAFMAEVEREKIAERTMRGKAARARSGRIPQATGRGIFGYRYDAASGTREIEPEQASVVRHMFEDFAAGKGCSRIADELNEQGITAFSGGRWYPIAVRRLLGNETYTGRTIYRRTKVRKVRDVARGKWVRRVTEREPKEWIEVEGATPTIIPRELFERVQERLNDPARRERARPSGEYPLRSRVRCDVCGAAVVGQTLMKGRYRYYRCRRSYAGPKADRCTASYIPKQVLEGAVRDSLIDLLAQPDRILAEAQAFANDDGSSGRLGEIERLLDDIESRQRRLLKLYTSGDMPEPLLREESQQLAARRASLEAERAALAPRAAGAVSIELLRERLPEATTAVRRYLASMEGESLIPLLEALDVQVTAVREHATIRGCVPLIGSSDQADLVTIERTSA